MNIKIGVDEVGRGCLVGNVVTAAVILNDETITGITDSKKISPVRRKVLASLIKETSLYHIDYCTAQEIDSLNIHSATLLAMQKSIEGIISKLKHQAKFNQVQKLHILVDGKYLPQLNINLPIPISMEAVIKGDSLHRCIGAASIIAKVARDEEMLALNQQYPLYQFDKHKGYPTKAHLSALSEYGILEQHRRSYAPVKNVLQFIQ